ncbi:DUF2510 domain-containing protein [Aestuariimicrobium ganziense]|uniref:DUF2510 domain-containing protein n=1 Tax=Aestuariimicrobium ganziense TaxID=2773677 RepID=UPI001942398F|nr:DUF2510 domain-containing protein [Aestuariimicrobium ganziense]
MSMPGWYPDPAGQPGQFRYWDGQGWSAETTPNPGQTPPPGAPGGTGGSPYDEPRRGGAGRIAAAVAVVLALALVGWLVVRSFNNDQVVEGDTNTSTPTVSAWDETSSPSATPSQPKDTGATMVECPSGQTSQGQARDGRLWGGGISVESLGWRPGGIQLSWVHDLSAETKTIQPGWFSVSAVGAVSVADGFEDPERSTRMMMSCFASSGYYTGFTGRKDVVAEKVTIDGKPGFHLRSEIYVQGVPNVKGDIVDVVVIDTGSPESLAIYFSSATIDDGPVIAEVDRARNSIKVG